MRVIIAGSRTRDSYEEVARAIEKSGFKITTVLTGKAKKGADRHGEFWANVRGIKVEPYPADWSNLDQPGAVILRRGSSRYNVNAGKYRNQQMADAAGPGGGLIAVWDGVSGGTKDMIERAYRAGLQVYIDCPVPLCTWPNAKERNGLFCLKPAIYTDIQVDWLEAPSGWHSCEEHMNEQVVAGSYARN